VFCSYYKDCAICSLWGLPHRFSSPFPCVTLDHLSHSCSEGVRSCSHLWIFHGILKLLYFDRGLKSHPEVQSHHKHTKFCLDFLQLVVGGLCARLPLMCVGVSSFTACPTGLFGCILRRYCCRRKRNISLMNCSSWPCNLLAPLSFLLLCKSSEIWANQP